MIVHKTADGRRYNVREIGPQDREHLLRGLEKMSSATRYQRFHGERTDFTSKELDFLIACDGVNHIAYVCRAMEYSGNEGEGIAVARFYRDAENPAWGEVAIVVIDAWQDVGVGGVLLRALADHCLRTNVVGWKATIVGDNDRAALFFAKFGTIVSRDWQDRALTLSIELTQ